MSGQSAKIIDFPQQSPAYDRGRYAFKEGINRAFNPYVFGRPMRSYSIDVTEWYRGWDKENDRFCHGAN